MRHPLRYRLEWLALQMLRWKARLVPRRAALAGGAVLGRLISAVWSRRRRIARDNLQRAYPEWTVDQVDTAARGVFEHFGRTTVEILRVSPRTRAELSKLVDPHNAESIDALYRAGRGGLLVSGHIGNWELLAGWIAASGYPLDVVVKPMRNPLSDRLYNDRRRDLGVRVIQTQVATRGIVESVKARRLVAILADQHAGEEGVTVTFFGRPVSTPRGPAVLSLRFGCPILTGVMVRRDDGRFDAFIDGVLDYAPTGDEEHDVRALTQAYTTRLENHIRRFPSQWLWTHRRWRG